MAHGIPVASALVSTVASPPFRHRRCTARLCGCRAAVAAPRPARRRAPPGRSQAARGLQVPRSTEALPVPYVRGLLHLLHLVQFAPRVSPCWTTTGTSLGFKSATPGSRSAAGRGPPRRPRAPDPRGRRGVAQWAVLFGVPPFTRWRVRSRRGPRRPGRGRVRRPARAPRRCRSRGTTRATYAPRPRQSEVAQRGRGRRGGPTPPVVRAVAPAEPD